jgi:2-dehydro-3-deoxy-D-arabinonate dehydratase
MRIYKTNSGILLETKEKVFRSRHLSWDAFLNQENFFQAVMSETENNFPVGDISLLEGMKLQAPIQNQEIWAAGVTYTRSRDARMEESKDAGGGSFYDKVYAAERPELFFKSTAHRCAGPGEKVRIRKDSSWNVPEPELVLVINQRGIIIGYTAGNDMSSRSIEGENPLYLPQAKTYDGSAAVGPCLYVCEGPISALTRIQMQIRRNNQLRYSGSVQINKMKRSHTELVEFLFRECSFPYGCLLMTGTCLVPESDFTLEPGDEIIIDIDEIGRLSNTVG